MSPLSRLSRPNHGRYPDPVPQQFVAGVDIGASNVRVVIADAEGEVHARRAGPLPEGEPAAVLRQVRRTVDDLVRGVWVGSRVAAIGVALPGAVDPAGGVAASIANMPGWDGVDVGELLGRSTSLPVVAENDANAAAAGEGWLGAARGMRDFVFVALGTGIGCGLVLDGRLYRGAHLLAGEVAFTRVTREQVREPDWQRCLEGIVSGRAFGREAAARLGPYAKAGDLFEAATSGDTRAAEWLAAAQEYLAMALSGVVALLDPEAIVFGGGVTAAQGERLIGPVREMVLHSAPVPPKILISSLGEDAQLLGAVRLALDSLPAE